MVKYLGPLELVFHIPLKHLNIWIHLLAITGNPKVSADLMCIPAISASSVILSQVKDVRALIPIN